MPRLDALGVVVKDLRRAVRFFGILGVTVDEKPGEDHLEAKLPSGVRLMLDSEEMVRGFMPQWKAPDSHRVALAFLCASTAEVDMTCAAMKAAGFTLAKEPWDAVWGQRYATVQLDPGISVDLFAPL